MSTLRPVTRVGGNSEGRAFVAWGLATAALLSACTTFEPVHAPDAASHPRLEVQFARPTELAGQRRDGERVVRARVQRVVGRALAVRNDSLVLEVHGWDATERAQRERRPFVTVIPIGSANLGTRRHSSGRTAVAILAVPITLYALLWIFCGLETVYCPFPSS